MVSYYASVFRILRAYTETYTKTYLEVSEDDSMQSLMHSHDSIDPFTWCSEQMGS